MKAHAPNISPNINRTIKPSRVSHRRIDRAILILIRRSPISLTILLTISTRMLSRAIFITIPRSRLRNFPLSRRHLRSPITINIRRHRLRSPIDIHVRPMISDSITISVNLLRLKHNLSQCRPTTTRLSSRNLPILANEVASSRHTSLTTRDTS